MARPYVFFIVLSLLVQQARSQDSTTLDKVIAFPDNLFSRLDKKLGNAERLLDKQTDKYLARLEKREKKLKKKLQKKDSVLAKNLFGDVEARYNELRRTTGKLSKLSSVYSGHLDTLTTTLKFLHQQDPKLTANPEFQKVQSQCQSMQEKLNATELIKKQLAQRQKLIKQEFEKLGMVKELKGYRKEIFYYQEQMKECKKLFEDPSKMEEKFLSLALKIPQFREFFQKNSLLSSLFALPGNNNGGNTLSGLQSRATVNQTIIDRFGSGPDVAQMMQQNVATAQGQLNSLKNKVTSYSSGNFGNASDAEMPEGFKPNHEKTKNFFQRLELGSNFQSQKARYYFPVTTDIGLSLGYRLNNNSIIGIGTSYKLGLGNGWDQIKITHQGIGLRSYIDWKLKGSLFITGGYEQNYLSAFHSIQQLQQYSAWQNSGLIGLSKKYKISKKIKGEVKLLWDFLSYQQVPRTQAVIFRVGYKFK